MPKNFRKSYKKRARTRAERLTDVKRRIEILKTSEMPNLLEKLGKPISSTKALQEYEQLINIMRKALMTNTTCQFCTGKGHTASSCATIRKMNARTRYDALASKTWKLMKLYHLMDHEAK